MAFPKSKSKAKKAVQDEPEFDNTNRGVLFENTEKKKSTHPDYRGSMTDSNGTEFWVAGWQKEAKSGQDYISLSFTEKETSEEDEEDEEDEIPVAPAKKKAFKKKVNTTVQEDAFLNDLPF